MFKISFKELNQQFAKSLKRFVVAYIYTILFVGISIYFVHEKNIKNQSLYYLLHIFSLGIVISMIVQVISEIKVWKNTTKLIYNLIVAAIFVAYYFTFQENFTLSKIYFIIFISFASVLFLMITPFIFAKNREREFWQYNFVLISKFVLVSIYYFIIYLGLVAAVYLFLGLFKINVNEKIFSDIALIIFGFVAVPLYLSLFPKNYDEVNDIYPPALKILSQYILLTLTAIYFVILYIYFFFNLIKWQMPHQEISYLVITFSVLGISTLVSLFPLKDKGNKFVKIYTKYFYWAFFPLLTLLFVSIIKRIGQYGITENRYYVIILAAWLLYVAIYSIITKFQRIKFIFVSLFLLITLSINGPWSSFNISKISQLSRLNKLLKEHKIIVNGKITDSLVGLKYEEYNDIEKTFEYLIKNHGSNIISKKFNVKVTDTLSEYTMTDTILKQLKIYHNTALDTNSPISKFYNYNFYSDFINVSGFDYYYKIGIYQNNEYELKPLGLKYVYDNTSILIKNGTKNLVEFRIDSLLMKKHNKEDSLASNEAIMRKFSESFDFELIINQISGETDRIESSYNYIDGVLLVKDNSKK